MSDSVNRKLLVNVLAAALKRPSVLQHKQNHDPLHGPTDEVERLLREGLPVAGGLLEDHGHFFPYGYAMDAEGIAHTVMPHARPTRRESSVQIEALLARFREGAEQENWKAVALFVDVFVSPPGGARTDAIQVGMEHRLGYCVDLFFPYRRNRQGGLEFDEPFSASRDAVVFDGQD